MTPINHNPAVPESPFEAFRRVVYTAGAESLANRLGMNRGTLYNKADADVESHHQPTMRDVIAVTRETGDMRILESLDRMFGRAGYEMTPGPVSDVALMELLCVVCSEHGAMNHALMTGLADKKFDREELRKVRAEAHDLINAVLNFVQRLEGLVDD